MNQNHKNVIPNRISSIFNNLQKIKIKMPPSSFRSSWTQSFPPKPLFNTITTDIPNALQCRVHIVTTVNSGLGIQLVRILYAKDTTIYIACRFEEMETQAILSTRKTASKYTGELVFLLLGLADLAKVKDAARAFFVQESKLHVPFSNAGVMVGPAEPPMKTLNSSCRKSVSMLFVAIGIPTKPKVYGRR